MFNNKTILVTGGTGSFGQAFVKKILKKYKPKKVIIFSRDELKQYEMQNHDDFVGFGSNGKNVVRYFIGDIRDRQRLDIALKNNVDYVIHAAALKQVPTAEYNPFEVVKTNIIGAQNLIETCISNRVKTVIALSTDKAAAPINLYGASKLASDKIFIAANNYAGPNKTQFSVVRYGNVFGSRGSVAPFFLKQKNKGYLTITDKNMTRFNITLNEGVDFVINSISKMKGGEIFIPKIPSFRVIDLAKAFGKNLKIKYIGVRPGEKIHEEMITNSDSMNTLEFKNYFLILNDVNDYLRKNKNYLHKYIGKYKKTKKPFSYNSLENNKFLKISELKQLISNLESQ